MDEFTNFTNYLTLYMTRAVVADLIVRSFYWGTVLVAGSIIYDWIKRPAGGWSFYAFDCRRLVAENVRLNRSVGISEGEIVALKTQLTDLVALANKAANVAIAALVSPLTQTALAGAGFAPSGLASSGMAPPSGLGLPSLAGSVAPKPLGPPASL